MKTEDFERLKAVCEKEGFDIELSSPWDQTYKISKKDPWEGVEFVQEKDTLKLYKVGHFHNSQVWVFSDVEWIWKDNCKPSTESAYVEQLKKEALERFPNIKEGDIIKTDWTIDNVKISKGVSGFCYIKYGDMFLYNTTAIYKEGKWAERVKERVKVVKFSNMGDINDNSMRFTFEISGKKIEQFYLYGVSEFLASQLEKYLNGEAE